MKTPSSYALGRTSYLETLKQLAANLPPQEQPDAEARAAYLRRLVSLAAKLPAVASINPSSASEAFARVLKPNARDILWRVAGATMDRRRSLSAASRDALRVLETTPDLLGPLGYARTELAHSGALGFFLNPHAAADLGTACLQSLIEMATEPSEGNYVTDLPDPLDLSGAVITTERSLGQYGRVDVSIDGPKAIVFIEVKIDAAEGNQQLSRYGKALAQLVGERVSLLVFLTFDEKKIAAGGHRQITFRNLLRVWLPIAASSRSQNAAYLSMYLKTIAQLYGVAASGEFDRWPLHTQRAALAFIERELETP